MKERLFSPISPVVISLLFFTLSLPPLFASYPGGSLTLSSTDKNINANEGLSTKTFDIVFSPSGIPSNAMYIVLTYKDEDLCENITINEKDFPLVLESEINTSLKKIFIALATPGFGITGTTTVARIFCNQGQSLKINTEESRAYASDGFGTELLLSDSSN